MQSRNFYLCMAVLAATGFNHAASSKGPRARVMRRTGRYVGRAEYKDIAGEFAAALNEIKGSLSTIGDRLKACEGNANEVKSLDTAVKAVSADLKAIRDELAAHPEEKKSLDTAVAATNGRLDELERKINMSVQNSKPGRKADRKSFDTLTAKMKTGDDVGTELKSLDSDLKVQDIFMEGQPAAAHPLLSRVYSRPTMSDRPRLSYYTGQIVHVKGVDQPTDDGGTIGTQGGRKKVILDVDTYEYQPTIDHEDVEDVGGQVLAWELDAAGIGTADRLAADLAGTMQGAFHATGQGFDEFAHIAKGLTLTNKWTEADINTLVAALPVKYRPGACFMVNKVTAANLALIVDQIGRSLWVPNMQEGIPAQLKGFDVIETNELDDNTVVFGNPKWGLAVLPRQPVTLGSLERLNGNYRPYYFGRYAQGIFDPRALQAMALNPTPPAPPAGA